MVADYNKKHKSLFRKWFYFFTFYISSTNSIILEIISFFSSSGVHQSHHRSGWHTIDITSGNVSFYISCVVLYFLHQTISLKRVTDVSKSSSGSSSSRVKLKFILTRPITSLTTQKMKFSIKDFFSKCDQISSFLRVWLHSLKKSLMKNYIFCAAIKEFNIKIIIN